MQTTRGDDMDREALVMCGFIEFETVRNGNTGGAGWFRFLSGARKPVELRSTDSRGRLSPHQTSHALDAISGYFPIE